MSEVNDNVVPTDYDADREGNVLTADKEGNTIVETADGSGAVLDSDANIGSWPGTLRATWF